jgi:hypothetical protein
MIFLFESPAWGFSSHVDDTEARCFLWMKNTTCLRSAACALPRIGNPTSETEIVAAKKNTSQTVEEPFLAGNHQSDLLKRAPKDAQSFFCRLSMSF